MKRIPRLIYPKGLNAAWTPILAAAILITTFAVTTAAWQATPAPTNTTVIAPYEKWANEDVVYIITEAERAAYRKLTSNEERQTFIEQFWGRRNPVPGSSKNTAKEEHYRRLSYANERYGSAQSPGWKSDRGRIYVIYGPPDEIESHPSPGKEFAYEVWLYRFLEGKGANVMLKFVDQTGGHEYQLQP